MTEADSANLFVGDIGGFKTLVSLTYNGDIDFFPGTSAPNP